MRRRKFGQKQGFISALGELQKSIWSHTLLKRNIKTQINSLMLWVCFLTQINQERCLKLNFFSRYYCLQSFVLGQGEPSNPGFLLRLENRQWRITDRAVETLYTIKRLARQECGRISEPLRMQNNLFSIKNGFFNQYCNYFTLGFKNALLNPKEYFDKLTDYSQANKSLNYLMAYYSVPCEVNVIIKLGYGIGDLQRVNDRFGLPDQRTGIPYQLKVNQFQEEFFALPKTRLFVPRKTLRILTDFGGF